MNATDLAMSPSELGEALTALIPTRQPMFIFGPPGVGKSSIVKQAATALKMECRDIRATLLDAVDIRGLPKTTTKKTTWLPPDFLPDSGEGALFLDELPQAPQLVQNALFSLILDRRVGDYVLPDGWMVIAAGNRVGDRAGAGRTNTALNSRFIRIDLTVSVEDWQAWAVANGIAPEIRGFIRWKPEMLFKFDPATNPEAFPCPRTWAFVNTVLPVTPQHLLHKVVAGAVSAGPAAEFISYLKLYQQLPDVDAVLAQPTTHIIPKDPSIMYALIGALTERCRKDKTKAGNLAKYGMRMTDEFGMLALRDVLALDRSLAGGPEVQNWIKQARAKGLFVAA